MMMDNEKFDAESVKEIVKNLDHFLWNITSNVVCTICHEIFTDPITTPCSHSFCSPCLKRLLTGVNNIKNGCPLCRKSIKRREAKSNHVLKNISKICVGFPAAFVEDVMNLRPDLKEISQDMVDGSRIAGGYLDKDKEKNCRNVKKQRKTNKKVSKGRVLSPSDVRLDRNETNPKNEECLDLKSISQIELKSQLYVAESPEIEKKLRTVKRVPSQQKVNDWLEKVGKTSGPSSSFLTDNWESRDESIIQGTENKDLGRSVMRIDFGNSEKPTEVSENAVKSIESDPYEFIASQRPFGVKPKRKTSRGRKKTLPGFQAIQNFTKDSVKKNYLNKTTDLFDDVSDNNLQKTLKTYSRKSDKTITIGEKTQEMLVRDYGNILSDSEESKVSEIIPRARRNLPLCPDIDSDSSIDKNIKKAKLDSTTVISDCESNSKKSDDENTKTKTLKTAKVQNKNSVSNGWSRVSNSIMDFEIAGKSRRPRRKSLDISGGEPSLNSSKKSVTEQSVEDDCVPKNDVQVEILSQNSERVIGFENPSSEEKKKNFKFMVEKMEEDLEFETSYNAKELIPENSTFTEESVEISSPKEIIYKTPKSKIIPFALLGKIRKKKRSSILFVKLGHLSPNFKRSRSTVVKLIFPKATHKNGRKAGVAVETQTDLLSQYKPRKGLEEIEHENFDGEDQRKINVEIQTEHSFLRSYSKEAQTSPTVERKDVTVQIVTDDTNSKGLEECDPPPLLKTQGNSSEDLSLDSELASQFNRTWITQGRRPTQNVKSFFLDKKEPEKAVTDLVSNDADVLMQRVVNNIDLDLARAKAVSRSPFKQPQQCEESDSDIFIEQTPPRNNSKNSNALLKTIEECPVPKSEASYTEEESYLILSGCQSKILEDEKTPRTFKHDSQQQKEKSLPKSFQKESDENNRDEVNVKSRKIPRDEDLLNRRICIASSGVTNRENIEKFVNKFKIEHLSCPRKDMTHLVVGLHDNDDDLSLPPVPYCTPKLLYAIANKKWVVTEEWVETCLKASAVVAEEPFESVDPAGGNGCSVARRSTDFLLKNCEIYLLGESKNITKDEFSSLIADCGGTVIRQLGEFSFSSGRIRMILVDDSDVQDGAQIRDLMRKHRTLVMSRDVIIMSIQSYKIVNFTPFLIQSVCYEEMIKWGYPPDLVKFEYEDEKDEGVLE